ncbi:L-ascorbate oxidase [Sarracenia purpurea var. burkii]
MSEICFVAFTRVAFTAVTGFGRQSFVICSWACRVRRFFVEKGAQVVDHITSGNSKSFCERFLICGCSVNQTRLLVFFTGAENDEVRCHSRFQIDQGKNFTYTFQVKDQIGSFSYFMSIAFHKAIGGFGGIRIFNRPLTPQNIFAFPSFGLLRVLSFRDLAWELGFFAPPSRPPREKERGIRADLLALLG